MPTKFMLCSFKTCPWVQRAAIALNEKNISFELNYIDRDNRPDWFLAISPHSKVPVLVIDDEHALFESNAIAEYLDEVTEPRLHPADALTRARNRAWTDYVPTFSQISGTAYAMDEADFKERAARIPERFAKLEGALEKRGNDGPFFNGADFSLVDCAYAPSLQRTTFLDRLYPFGAFDGYPLLSAWRDALLARASVIASTVPEFEQFWRDNLIANKRWVARFIHSAAAE